MGNDLVLNQGKRQIVLFFISLKPKHLSKKILKERELDYSASVKRLMNLGILNRYEVIFCENTCGSKQEFLNSSLGPLVEGSLVSWSQLNAGIKNKGVGELSMASNALNEFADVFKCTDVVHFMSGRHLSTSPDVIERASNLKRDAIVSNPDFFYLNGDLHETEKLGMYNDMYFAMKKEIFVLYMQYFESRKSEMLEKMINSESILFSFCSEMSLDLEWLERLSLLRREYYSCFRYWQRSRWHLC